MYGIKDINGKTTVDSMLLQTLQAQGMAVDWYTQVPNGAPKAKGTNEAAAAFIRTVRKRPGQRLKTIEERICAAPLTAAIKRRGGVPKAHFKLLDVVRRATRKRLFTSRGNLIGAPTDVAFVERDLITTFVTKHLRCSCGGRLAYCRQLSTQTGVCAQWRFVCERSCKLPALETSKRLHGDDYLLNSKLNYACEFCALGTSRLSDALRTLGTRAPSSKDMNFFKHEIEPVARVDTEESMARAHERNVKAGNTDWASIDCGYTSLRNAHGGTMCAHAADGGIVALEHKRLTDEGATTSQALETLCFLAILQRAALLVYGTIVMDGCQALAGHARAASKRVQGDLWHVQKNWYNWAEPAIKQLCSRPHVPDEDKSELVAVAAVKVAAAPPKLGKAAAGENELAHLQRRLREIGSEPLEGADATALQLQFQRGALQSVMTEREKRQQVAYERYVAEKARRKAAASARAGKRTELAGTEAQVLAWRREFRSLMYLASMYTLSLRGTINPATESEWTDTERAVEWKRVWRLACKKLALGEVTHPILVQLKHACIKQKTADFSWTPPGAGFVAPRSFAYQVIDSLVCDTTWEDKFPALIDCRTSSCNESFYHKLRVFAPQKTHYSRFYSLAIFAATLSWNENIVREILGYKWVRGKTGPLAKSAGRWYKVPRRADQTDHWRTTLWEHYLLSLQPAPAPSAAAQPVQTYWLGWMGQDPPAHAATIVGVGAAVVAAVATTMAVATTIAATVAAVPEKLKVDALKARLSSLGLTTTGKKAELVARLQAAENPGHEPVVSGQLSVAVRQQRGASTSARVPYDQLVAKVINVDGGEAGQPASSHMHTAMPLIEPCFLLPGAYQMPAKQKQQRVRTAGAPKWTAKRQAAALEDIKQGKTPAALVPAAKYQKKDTAIVPEEVMDTA